MDDIKKKRPDATTGDGRTSVKTKKERFNGGVTAEDAELEEFLAILNRLKAGFNYFHKKGGGGCVGKSTAVQDSGSLNPAFELEDFVQFHDGRLNKGTGDRLRNGAVFGFDLNADPESY